MNGKRYFNEIKKRPHQLFSKLHDYFSTKSPHTQYTFANAALVFEVCPLKKIGFLFLKPFPHLRLHLTQRLTVLTSTH